MMMSQGGYGINGNLILLMTMSTGAQDLYPARHLLPY